MDRVVIVVANSRWFDGRPYMEPIMALPILASILEDGNIDFDIIDCNGFNYTEEQCAKAIKNSQAKMVLITALSVELHKQYAKVAEIAKLVSSDIVTVMGGVYATTCYEHIMLDKNVDYVMLGHAEERLCQFLNMIVEGSDLSQVAGIGYRKNNQVIINPVTSYIGDVDKMTTLNYSKVNLTPYVEHGFRVAETAKREVPIITSYGCPHNCLFCATRTISGRKVAYREVEDVIEEIRYLKSTYEIDSIMFLDDNILADEERAKHLFTRMINEKFNLKFRLMSTAAWHLNEEILDLMTAAGCYALTLSIESGCDRVLHKIIRKPLKKEIVPGVIKMCQDRGIFVLANIVIGFPGETWDEIRESIAFGEMCNPDYLQIFMATLLPKTDLYYVAKEQGCIPEDFDFFNEEIYTGFFKGNISTEEFVPEELEILRSYEWDRINFASEEKRKKFCEYRGITPEQLAAFRRETRKSAGHAQGLRKGSI